jgi:hypothetical protein
MRRNASSQCAHSVASVRRNLRRAGVLKYSSSTVTVVPAASAAGAMRRRAAFDLEPPGVRLARARDASARRDTAAMDASASPRKPSVRSPRGPSTDAIFDVAWRATASAGPRARCRAVVRDAHALDAAAREVDVDLRGARVERVLEQLLQAAAGPLDDLAGGDLVDQEVGQRADGATRPVRRGSSRAQRA